MKNFKIGDKIKVLNSSISYCGDNTIVTLEIVKIKYNSIYNCNQYTARYKTGQDFEVLDFEVFK